MSRPRVWALPDDRIAVRAMTPDCWLLVDAAGRMSIAHGELADDAVELHPQPGPAPGDRCPAHGQARCQRCGRISTADLTDDGESCRGCDYWGGTGMHWDTCPHRIRGDVVVHPKLGVS